MRKNLSRSTEGHHKSYIFPLDTRRQPEAIGNKAAGLFELNSKHFLIPYTVVCTWHAYLDYSARGNSVIEDLRLELQSIIKDRFAYAVRSSANVEDSLEQSFAGQFTTSLNVMGVEEIISSILMIWEDTRKESVQTYMQKILGSSQDLKMAVIIQEMIQPVLSGVVFSKNPITTMDEVIVEAVEGFGTALVQEGCTPLRWVNKWGKWTQLPDASPVEINIIQTIVDGAHSIVNTFHKEVDLEWVFDGKAVYWLQKRDITSIQDVIFYSNRMAKEMTPGQIKPLVWTVSIPNPSRAWVTLLTEMIGKNNLDPMRLLKLFHYRAYFNMAEIGKVFASLGLPRESLEMMLGVLPPGSGKPPMKPGMGVILKIPRLAGFLYDKWRFERKLERLYPILYKETHRFPIKFEAGTMGDGWLIEQIDKIHLLNRQIAYMTVVTILLMQAYTAMFRRGLKKIGVDFQQIDLTEGLEEIKLFDPNYHLMALNAQFQQFPDDIQVILRKGDYPSFQATQGIESFKRQFSEFLEQFGHMSDTTAHFCNPAWRETPGLILKLIADFRKPEINPHNRLKFQELPKNSFTLRLFYQRARKFSLWREEVSSLFSYSVMLFRAYYLEIGVNWVERNLIQDASDILYLYDEEVRCVIDERSDGSDLAEKIDLRRQEMIDCRDAVLPEVIMGEKIPLILASSTNKLLGTPTAKGYYTGPVRVIRGVDEFYKLNLGDVLVIPYSDVSWTPLFAKAGAVIAESGGILSHSSIIAREYNIPGVVCVNGAMNLTDGTLVTIDGFKGEILVHEQLNVKPGVLVDDEQAGNGR